MAGPSDSEIQQQVQHRLIEELSTKHQEFKTHLELLDEVVFRIQPNGEFCLLNPAWSKCLGWSPEESIGRLLTDYMARTNQIEKIQKLLLGNEPLSCNIELKTRFGQIRTFRLRARRDKHWYGSLQDITELLHVIDELKDSQKQTQKLSQVASRTDNLVVISDENGLVEWVNTSFEKLTGYSLAEVRGRNPGKMLQGPETDPQIVKIMSDGVKSGDGFAVEVVNYDRSGAPYWVAIDCSVVRDKDGKVINFIAIQRDISERKNAELYLRESERRHRNVLNAVTEPIFRCNLDLQLTFSNDAWQRYIGDSNSNYPTSYLLDYVHRNDKAGLVKASHRAVAEDAPVKQELRMLTKEGSWRRVEIVFSASYPDLEKQHVLLTGTVIDIEDHWQVTQAIKKAKKRAEELSQARTRFVANMSHEIRTPLNAVIGMTSVLETTQLSAKQKLCLDTIRSGGEALLAVVNDILDFSKLDQDDFELESIEFDWDKLFEEAVDIIAPAAEKKGLKLRLQCETTLPKILVGDLHRIRQVLLNLLSNAVKFTATGSVTLKVAWQYGLRPNQGYLSFAVIDTGIGIPAERIENLFTPFTQADASVTREFGGTGLGLAICRQICNKMGGDISAKSILGAGTTMKGFIPLSFKKVIAESQDLRSITLNFSSASVYSAIKSLTNYLRLPLVIDEKNVSNDSVKLTALDGTVTHYQLARLDKVTSPKRLLRKLIGGPSEDRLQPISPITKNTAHILVAEDSFANQIVIQEMLAQLGFDNVSIVDNGEQALHHVKKQAPDLILLDLHMPIMDGLTTARELQKLNLSNCPTICALTADVTKEAMAAARDAGIEHWVSKPVTRQTLEDFLDTWQALKHQQPVKDFG